MEHCVSKGKVFATVQEIPRLPSECSAPSTTPGATHAKLDSVGSARLKKTGMQDHNVCEKSEMNEMNEKCLYPYLQRCDRETNKHPVPNHTRNDSQPQEEKGKHSMAWWTCRRLFVLVDVVIL